MLTSCAGALEQLKGELAQMKQQWVVREEEMRGFCEERQQRAQEEMCVAHGSSHSRGPPDSPSSLLPQGGVLEVPEGGSVAGSGQPEWPEAEQCRDQQETGRAGEERSGRVSGQDIMCCHVSGRVSGQDAECFRTCYIILCT